MDLKNIKKTIRHKLRYYIRKYSKKSNYDKIIMYDYVRRTGEEPFDIKNPITYKQKIQWSKLYDQKKIKTTLTDKIAVRDWIKSTIGDKYLIPCYGTYDSFDDIDFNMLPEQFVIKTNHASGTNIIVKNKSKLNIKKAKKKINSWLKENYAYTTGLQLQYKDIKPRILIEKYMVDSNGEFRDYKFLCFGGKPYFCWVDFDRFENHTRNIYDCNWNLQNWTSGFENNKKIIEKPKSFDDMVKIVEKLCLDFNQVRVDMYDVDGNIYFGEMTFTHANGYEIVNPKEIDLMLGNLWKI